MNDASRELGAALGVAVMGSLAASQYGGAVNKLTAGLPTRLQETAGASIAGALRVASELPGPAGEILRAGADGAFIDGIHLAVTAGSALAFTAAVITARFLPRVLSHDEYTYTPTAIEPREDAATREIAGVPPVYADQTGP